MTKRSESPNQGPTARRIAWGVLSFLAGAAVVATMFPTGCGEEPHRFDSRDLVKPSTGDQPVGDERPILRIAVAARISPETTRDNYEDLFRLIGDDVGRRVVFAQRRTYAEVTAMLARKEVELAFLCSGPYAKWHQEFDFELLAVPVIAGRTVHHSYVISRAGEHAQSLEELRGMRFAFSDPDSNTGWLSPTYILGQRGETPESFFSKTFFTGSHDASIRAVADELADGAAIDSLVWEFVERVDPDLTGRLRVIERSRPYGIPPVVVHPDLNADLKARLRQILFSLHESEAAIPLLEQLQIDRFAEGDDGAYDPIREMWRWVDQQQIEGSAE